MNTEESEDMDVHAPEATPQHDAATDTGDALLREIVRDVCAL